MSIGLKSKIAVNRQVESRPSLRIIHNQASQSLSTPASLKIVDPSVRRLPDPQPLPIWLRSLIGAQRTTSLLTLLLTSIVLGVYSQIVYSQQLWNREYQRLENLQRQERQLIATNEALKHQMAKQAERSDTGLILTTPGRAIFVQPAPTQRPAIVVPVPEVEQDASSIPLGY